MAAGRIERESLGWSSRSPCVHVEHAISWQGQGPGLHLHEGKKKKNAWWPIHQYMMPTVLPMHTISSISHITPFFRSFFEDVQTEEVFVFFSSFEIDWFRWLRWHESNAHAQKGRCHATHICCLDATQRNRVCVCMCGWSIPRYHIRIISIAILICTGRRRPSRSIARGFTHHATSSIGTFDFNTCYGNGWMVCSVSAAPLVPW
jgi:hypothetical protein